MIIFDAAVRHVRTKPASVLAIILLFTFSTQALAWGDTGHKIVAKVAEHYLANNTRTRIQQLIADDQNKEYYARECPGAKTVADFLMCVASWADHVRNDRPETANWHFVDIPNVPPRGTKALYTPARDCPVTRDGDCVVAAIEQFQTMLEQNEHGNDRQYRRKIEALKFLVHFVGDMHQPLHSSDNHDRGGNDFKVFWQGSEFSNQEKKYEWNLHAVWDTGIIVQSTKDPNAYAARLISMLETRNLEKLQRGTVADWANETHAIALRTAYNKRFLQNQKSGINGKNKTVLGPEYLEANKSVVDEQLMKAGVRLARLLNDALGK